MPKKKSEEIEETPVVTDETAAVEDVAVEAAAEETAPAEEPVVEAATAEETHAIAEEAAPAEETAVEAAPLQETAAVEEASPAAAEKPKKAAKTAIRKTAAPVAPADFEKKVKLHKRAEKIGIVSSDKMTKTVVVRVDRLVKHPIYRKYVKKRKKFMAHDDMGAKIGDKVKIVETRPLSARKRWRVVEIIHRAEN